MSEKAGEMAELDHQHQAQQAPAASEEEVRLNPENTAAVGSAGVSRNKCKLEWGIDLDNRDPNSMNDHVKVQFSEIFGEPEKEIYSFDTVWCLSYRLFSLTKSWCYKITSLILALPLALVWGVVFALLAFCNNWCYVPSMRCCHIELLPFKKIWDSCIGTFIAPCYQAIGLIFSRIKLTHIHQGNKDLV